jgi:hypothetical protein
LAFEEVDRLLDGGGIVAVAISRRSSRAYSAGRARAKFSSSRTASSRRALAACGGGRQGEEQQAGDRRNQGHAAGNAHARAPVNQTPRA